MFSPTHTLLGSNLYPTSPPPGYETGGQVGLWPENLNRIEELVSADAAALRRDRALFAERLAFGEVANTAEK
jgi:hypothetical protein